MKRKLRPAFLVLACLTTLSLVGVLSWRAQVLHSSESRVADSTGESVPARTSLLQPAEADEANLLEQSGTREEELSGVYEAAAHGVVGSATTRTPEEWRALWINQVEGTAAGLVEGDFRIEELAALAKSLIEGVVDTQPDMTEEGTLVFPIFDEESLGSASLHTVSEVSTEFELRMNLVAPIGDWMEGDASSTEYTMSFGLNDAGDLEGMGVCVQAHLNQSSLDAKWLEGSWLPNKGSVVLVGATESTWSPIQTELSDQGLRYQVGEPTTLPSGCLGSESAQGLGALFRSLRRRE